MLGEAVKIWIIIIETTLDEYDEIVAFISHLSQRGPRLIQILNVGVFNQTTLF